MPDPPSRPPANAADEEFNPVAHTLANTNPLSHPFVRALFNYIASKVSTLSKSKISRLTDDEISRLIKDEYSRLTEDEIDRLMDAEFDRLKAIADSIFRFFTGNSLESFFASKEAEITPRLDNVLTLDDIINHFVIPAGMIIGMAGIGAMMIVAEPYMKRLTSSKHAVIVTTNVAQERLRPLKRSIFLSKYSRTPDLKGLKGIGVFYKAFRQEVEQHQKDTSRAVETLF